MLFPTRDLTTSKQWSRRRRLRRPTPQGDMHEGDEEPAWDVPLDGILQRQQGLAPGRQAPTQAVRPPPPHHGQADRSRPFPFDGHFGDFRRRLAALGAWLGGRHLDLLDKLLNRGSGLFCRLLRLGGRGFDGHFGDFRRRLAVHGDHDKLSCTHELLEVDAFSGTGGLITIGLDPLPTRNSIKKLFIECSSTVGSGLFSSPTTREVTFLSTASVISTRLDATSSTSEVAAR